MPLSFHILTTNAGKTRGPKMASFLSIVRGNQDIMSQITDSVSSIAQDLGEKAAVIAQDMAIRAQAVGDFGADLVDSGLKKLQDAGVVAKPKRSKKPWLALLIIIVGGAVAFKLLKGRGASSPSPAMPEADRLADANAVKVG